MTRLLLTVLACGLLGACSLVAGVIVLTGIGWGLIASGVIFIATAFVLRMGLTANG